MRKLQFKTNINCSGCVAGVSPTLSAAPDIETWEVDTQSPEKTLTVSTGSLTENEIVALVEKAGYKAVAVK